MNDKKNLIIKFLMTSGLELDNLRRELEEKARLAKAGEVVEDPELQKMLEELDQATQKLKDISLDLGLSFVKLGELDLSKF